MKLLRILFRPWSLWLFLLSVPLSYVLFVGLFSIVVVANSGELNDLEPSLVGFSILWVPGTYILIPGCWLVLSLIGSAIRRLSGNAPRNDGEPDNAVAGEGAVHASAEPLTGGQELR
ncbi:hypothetical protein HUN08_07120 [Gordonia sp. X0973]|uniref:hypothetical protein n=1 Tax=Gordonia sp. X0973 TaxID=2742602 RepID=UPI000F53E24C|nr:hypothetical protein [Gordonia sp. X0973]QKT06988.1 hypothetical protein HUN08_07120 [Gordonia sp. X0973]